MSVMPVLSCGNAVLPRERPGSFAPPRAPRSTGGVYAQNNNHYNIYYHLFCANVVLIGGDALAHTIALPILSHAVRLSG